MPVIESYRCKLEGAGCEVIAVPVRERLSEAELFSQEVQNMIVRILRRFLDLITQIGHLFRRGPRGTAKTVKTRKEDHRPDIYPLW